MGRIGREIWGFVFWTYERSSWRYNIMVALILIFIFATPRGIFHDKAPAAVEAIQEKVFRVDADALVPNGMELETDLARILREHEGHEVRIEHHEALRDARGTLLAYKVWVQ